MDDTKTNNIPTRFIVYDVFIFTGPSPINTPWLGLKHFTPRYAMAARREHMKRNKEDGIV